ncbi:mechanosensitive ion channel family protein [Thalassotalea maritima]|uniref:mechanosensitive ion channel family protein n=1 Tax=Thalassotalea maritima TaxID=3242416 RepID=UPI0035282D73
MAELINQWLQKLAIDPSLHTPLTAAIGLSLLLIICWLSFYISKHYVLTAVHRLVLRSSNTIDDLLIEHNVFGRIARLVPTVLLLALHQLFIGDSPELAYGIELFAKILLTMQVAQCFSALLSVVNHQLGAKSKDNYLPLTATIQLIKLAIYLVAIILAISIAINKNPVYLLSGLGALTAVLILVFQDTIKGLVASIQVSANKMVAPGDWITMPQYGADGDVQEIALTTVKVKNFDNTISTIPTYALVSESFKNWGGMAKSGGRRIKRSINIDMNSIQFCDQALLDKLSKLDFLKEYLSQKSSQLNDYNKQKGYHDADNPNIRRLTNIGTFRAYISEYLRNHPNVHGNMTCMVRQLPPTEMGLPLELYFFSNDTAWVNYENIQADIFDHMLAIAPIFELRLFQTPTGHDWQGAISNSALNK